MLDGEHTTFLVTFAVRNHGKFIYCGIDGTTKKQRLYVVIKKYV